MGWKNLRFSTFFPHFCDFFFLPYTEAKTWKRKRYPHASQFPANVYGGTLTGILHDGRNNLVGKEEEKDNYRAAVHKHKQPSHKHAKFPLLSLIFFEIPKLLKISRGKLSLNYFFLHFGESCSDDSNMTETLVGHRVANTVLSEYPAASCFDNVLFAFSPVLGIFTKINHLFCFGMWDRQGKKCVTVTGVPLIACPVSIACPMYCSPCPHTVLHRRDHLICRKKGIVKGKAAKWRFLECVRSTARVVAQKFPRVLHFCAWREMGFGQKNRISLSRDRTVRI